MDNTSDMIDMAYDCMEGMEDLMQYHARHGTPSLLILTQYSPAVAAETAEKLASIIEGKRVVEIGAGVGFLAIEMAKRAESVVAIEADPSWSWIFTRSLYRHKPSNLTWIFGAAESVADQIRGDVAVICTRSGHDEMRAVGRKMCPKVVFAEMSSHEWAPDPSIDVMSAAAMTRMFNGDWQKKDQR